LTCYLREWKIHTVARQKGLCMEELQIQRDGLYRYYYWRFLLSGLVLYGVGIAVTGLMLLLGMRKSLAEMAARYTCRLEADGVRIVRDYLWYGRFETFIPYRKITDVKLCRGPIERRLGLQSISIHTAGHGSREPAGRIRGAENPEQVVGVILQRMRDSQSRASA